MKKALRLLGAFCFALLLGNTAFGQGSTSSRITGQVTDGNGGALPGATVLAVHTPTGFEYGTVTNVEGLFTLNNVNVGGPYEITITFVGFSERKLSDIYLSLGQTETLDISLEESTIELESIVVSTGGLFDGNRTGSETKVTSDDINSLPTADRGLNDYLRLTPQAAVGNNGATNSGAISFAGVNNRFNAIFIDGAVNNDVFGLANSGTNGGQAGISPISPDALEQIQVVLAPYDVTLGGFAGGGINAVTRSGTNNFEGSAYYFLRNESLAGKTPTDDDNVERTKLDPFTAQTYGFRLGGPLIKNKLFFFTNVEIQRDESPRPFVSSAWNGDSGAGIDGVLEDIRQKLINDYNYDPGGFRDNPQTTDGEKVLFKLDWNINQNHKLSARHSYVKGTTEIHPTPNSNRVTFGNVGYNFPSTTNSTAIELKSNLGPNASNNLILGATIVRDDRELLGDPFPQIIIPDGSADIVVGTDNFSFSNIVFQDVYTLTNNFNLYKGKHTWTFGTHNEFFKVQNLFTIFSTPRYEYFFDGVNRFLSDENPDLILFGHEQLANGQSAIRFGDEAENLGPTFNALQMAFYVQDEIQVSPDFKLTLGLRADIPVFLEDAPLENVDFNTNTVPVLESLYDLEGAEASNTPNTQVLFSPRIGFNWDASGDKTTQLRGGVGVFTSRVPWVWPGGMYIRNGLNSAFNVLVFSDEPIYASPQEWVNNLSSSVSPTGDVDLFSDNFKYPQILRASAAVDHKLPGGIETTAEVTFTKTLNNIFVRQVNLRPSVGRVTVPGAGNRPAFDFGSPVDPTYTNITHVSNTSQGYTFNFSAQASKSFSNGLDASVAYSFTRADALFDGTGFINNTNWQNILSVRGNNNPSVGRSVFDAGSRITAFLSYRKEYLNNFATGISLFYTGRDGSPYTYVYANNISDLSGSLDYNDLLYVPVNNSEDITFIPQTDNDGNVIVSADQQWAAFNNFIENDDYLSERRGQFVEQNRVRTPFEHIIDLKLTQDFFISQGGTRHAMQISFDIFNFTNFLNKDWGRRYFVGGNTFPLLTPVFDSGALQGFQFNDPGDPYDIVQAGTYSSRWIAQLGVRYSF